MLCLLRQVGCRMLVLDEIHNLLAAPVPRQRELLNSLRYLGNELRVPLVWLGTREAHPRSAGTINLKTLRAISSATLGEDGPELGRLLASFEAVLPLREPSGLGAPAMRAHVLGRSEGTTGEIVAVLTAATDAALSAGEERIVTLDAAEYQPPSVRRRLFERELQ